MYFQETLGIGLGADQFSLFTGKYAKRSHSGTMFPIPGNFADLYLACMTVLRKGTVVSARFFTVAMLYSFGKAAAFFVEFLQCHFFSLKDNV